MTETVAFITFSRHYVVLYSAAIPAYIDSFLFDEGLSGFFRSFEHPITSFLIFVTGFEGQFYLLAELISRIYLRILLYESFHRFLITIGSGDIVNYDSRGLFFAATPTTKPASLSFLFSRRVAKSFWSAVSTRIPFPLIFFT